MVQDEFQVMAAAEGEHWWYRTLHALVARALALHDRGLAARVLDAGCGTGGLLRVLAGHGYRRLAGFDVSEFAVATCRDRGLPVHWGDLRAPDTLQPHGSWDAIVSNDTLYFFNLPTQEAIVRRCFDALAPGGLLVLNVPALLCFRGTHDQAVGITRRFNRTELIRLLVSAGFTPMQVRFWPFVVAPWIYITRLSQRWRTPPNRAVPRSDLRPHARWVNEVLAGITRAETAWLHSPPFGSSLFAVARKPGRRAA